MRVRCLCVFMSVLVVSLTMAGVTMAQTSDPGPQDPPGGPQMPGMAGMSGRMTVAGPLGEGESREGSGTSWQPDDSPMHMAMTHKGPWMLMLHGNAFLEYIKTGSDRGDDQFGSINWVMGMARRDAGGGPLTVRAMLSAEPATVGRCGYPNLLQSGEACDGASLHDRQHPHDVFMELAVDYRHAVARSVAIEIYGGPAAEPALGPVAFPHRPSAASDPIAPITHHWLDSTHVSFGVVTGGLYGTRWKAEASAFNGREPDDRRYDINLAALDSYSGRFWWLPTSRWAFQLSAGHLTEAESRANAPSEDVTRVTASASYQRTEHDRSLAATVAWGRNIESDNTTSAILAEAAFASSAANLWSARVEVVGKTAVDLVLSLPGQEVYTVTKVRGGYTRWFWQGAGVSLGAGAAAGWAFLPPALQAAYGSRTPVEATVFLTVRPR